MADNYLYEKIEMLRQALEDMMCIEHREGMSLETECIATDIPNYIWYCKKAREALEKS